MQLALETFIIEGVDDDDSVPRARDAEPAVPERATWTRSSSSASRDLMKEPV